MKIIDLIFVEDWLILTYDRREGDSSSRPQIFSIGPDLPSTFLDNVNGGFSLLPFILCYWCALPISYGPDERSQFPRLNSNLNMLLQQIAIVMWCHLSSGSQKTWSYLPMGFLSSMNWTNFTFSESYPDVMALNMQSCHNIFYSSSDLLCLPFRNFSSSGEVWWYLQVIPKFP